MAITITQERKKQKYLILVLPMLIFGTLFVAWWGFFRGEKMPSAESVKPVIYTLPQVKIDWQLLEDIRGETIRPFEEISPFQGEFGRKNPFISY